MFESTDVIYMPFYPHLENIHKKRHTQFRKPNDDLYDEQLFGSVGFDGMSSNLCYENRPTQVKEVNKKYGVTPKVSKKNNRTS